MYLFTSLLPPLGALKGCELCLILPLNLHFLAQGVIYEHCSKMGHYVNGWMDRWVEIEVGREEWRDRRKKKRERQKKGRREARERKMFYF